MGLLLSLFIFIAFILFFASIPVVIATIAYVSRKKKRTLIEKDLPSNLFYTAPVRLNTPKQNAAVVKLKAFEYSGILYLEEDKICVKGTSGQFTEFDLLKTEITWPGVQIQNGIIQWFCLEDKSTGQRLYVNAETGIFVFRLSSKLPSTKQVYEDLLKYQGMAAIGN